ncbi:MAG: AmfC protein [Acidimicrobiales bacterium]
MDLADVDLVAEPGYLDGLTSWPIEEVRRRRTECQRLEDATSYLRRLVQGRLDIVRAALARRAGDRRVFTLADLITELPDTLGDRLVAPGRGNQPPHVLVPPDLPDLTAELDAVCDPTVLADLAQVPIEVVTALEAALAGLERVVSARRRLLFDRIDAMAAELTRRYRSGEASIDSLLG